MQQLDYSDVMTNDPQDWAKFLGDDEHISHIDQRTRKYLARHRK